MKLIECKLGRAEPHIAGQQYSFERDQYGRFVARVDNDDHAACLLAVEHYVVVPENPAPEPDPDPSDEKEADRLAREAAERDAAEAKAKAEQEEADRLKAEQEAAEAQARAEAAEAKAKADAEAALLQSSGQPPIGLGQSNDEEPFVDDVMLIKGIGATMKGKLAALSITSLRQIAAFDEAAIAALDEQLDLRGAIVRNEWVQQAQALLPGDVEPTE